MPRVLVAGRIHADGLALLEAEPGLEIDLVTDPGAELPAAQLAAADALLIRYGVLREQQLVGMPRLRVISRHGVGCDNLPVDALSRRGIPVMVIGPVTAVSVAEQVMALLLALLKRVTAYDAAVRNGDWQLRDSLSVGELTGRRLLLLGFGRIGSAVARRAQAFDMQVEVFDPFVDAARIEAAGCRAVEDWRAELPHIDVLSLHLPLDDRTRGLLGADEFALMKPTAMVINAARGGLLDEDALYQALSGHLSRGGAGLDCFASEPPAPGLPLLQLSNVVLSPHSAALTAEASQRAGVVAARNVLEALAGRPDPRLVFNPGALCGATRNA